MNVEELSMIGPDVDLETVNAINRKVLLAFVNHFIVNTTLFLNKLSKACEDGLMSLESKIQKLEMSIVLLESKLNSVPGLEVDEVTGTLPAVKEAKPKEKEADVDISNLSDCEIKPGIEKINDNKTLDNEINASNLEGESGKPELDLPLMKYVKMLQFGVPQEAVKLKLEQENIDKSLHNLILNYNKKD